MISLTIHLDVAHPKWKRAFRKMEDKMEHAAAVAFLDAKKPRAFSGRNFELNILLTDDRTIRRLNHDYRGRNKPTNVLSFPQFNLRNLKAADLAQHPARGPIPLGDVVLAWETLNRECKAQKKSLENHAVHLIVHGTLHLLGYDHMKAKEAKSMEKLECDILESMGYPDPYHDPQP